VYLHGRLSVLWRGSDGLADAPDDSSRRSGQAPTTLQLRGPPPPACLLVDINQYQYQYRQVAGCLLRTYPSHYFCLPWVHYPLHPSLSAFIPVIPVGWVTLYSSLCCQLCVSLRACSCEVNKLKLTAASSESCSLLTKPVHAG